MAEETLMQKVRTRFESAESEFNIGNEVQGRRDLLSLASMIRREIGVTADAVENTESQKDETQEERQSEADAADAAGG